MNKYRAILFDMDGVLIDSEEFTAKAAIMALRDFGIEAEKEDFEEFVGRGEDMYVGGVARKHGRAYDLAMKARMYYYYGLHVEEETKVPEEALPVLQELKARGYKMAVCSSADREKVLHNVRAVGVAPDFFDAFITGSEVEHLKPAPDIYLQGAKALGAEPGQCLVVEDAPSGVRAGHAAGIPVAGVLSTFPEEVLCSQGRPEFLLNRLQDLLELV